MELRLKWQNGKQEIENNKPLNIYRNCKKVFSIRCSVSVFSKQVFQTGTEGGATKGGVKFIALW